MGGNHPYDFSRGSAPKPASTDGFGPHRLSVTFVSIEGPSEIELEATAPPVSVPTIFNRESREFKLDGGHTLITLSFHFQNIYIYSASRFRPPRILAI